jgi:tape measure domain-containing protein
MSNTVDSRVVEMRFDNKNFESNVAQSMSTLDKLKAKLNLSGASKGLENLDKAVKNTNMSGLASGIETVNAKFSAMQVIGMTALSRITNVAMTAGKNIVSALTINPVKDGLNEYETQINSVQTILANTQKEGTNVKMVNAALDELNTYADKTIYNFTEMTRNIGTFTAAGVKLNTSVKSIQGIANLAAVSGSTSQQASTAMYQLSQALAAGKVSLMDWNSVVNAGMGGQVFQDALIRTSENLKTGAKEAINTYGTFRESLTKSGWLTTEVLTETLNQFAGAYSKADLMSQGYSEKQAEDITKMAKTAMDSATKVKTFTQLIDTLKERLGSGWTETWRLLIGDFEEAKSLWTGVSDVLGTFIDNMSNARNAVIKSTMGKGLGAMGKELTKAFNGINEAAKTVDKVSSSLTNLGKVSTQVINGDFGNGETRFKKLTKAGINYYTVQNAVNKALGNSKQYTKEQIAEQDKLTSTKSKTTETTKKEVEANTKLTDEQKKQIIAYAQMSDAQLKAAGVTKEQQQALADLKTTSEQMGIPIKELVMNIDQINGRWIMIKGFANIGNGLIKVFKSIGDAWKETMKPITGNDIFNVIVGFQKFTRQLIMTDQTADKLKRTFKGVFAMLDVVMTVTGGGLKLAFKVLGMVLKAFDTDLLTVTANIGDAIVAIRDFLFSNNLITSGFKLIASGVKMAVNAIKSFINMIKGIPQIQNFANFFKSLDWNEIGQNVVDGLKNGLKGGISQIPQILIQIGQSMIDAICGILGIASPSKVMYDIGVWAIQGLINGVLSMVKGIVDAISNIGNIIADTFSKIFDKPDFDFSKLETFGKNIMNMFTNMFSGLNFGKILSLGAMGGVWYLSKRALDVADSITAPFEGVGSVLESAAEVIEKSNKNIQRILKNTSKVIKSFSKVLNAKAWQMKAEAMKNIALSIAILAGAVYLLAKLDTSSLQKGVVAIGALAAILAVLAFAMNQLDGLSFSKNENGFNVKGLKTSLLSIGTAILLIATSVKIMGKLKPEEVERGFKGLVGIIAAIGAVIAAYGTLVKGKSAKNIGEAGKMIKRLATSMLIIAIAAKIIGKLSPAEMTKGAAFMVAFGLFVAAMTKVATVDGKIADKLGGMMIRMAIAMGLMVGVVKLVSGLSPSDMVKGAAFAGAFVLFVYGLKKAASIDNGTSIAKLSLLLFNVTNSMMMMVGVVKLIGLLSESDMLKGVAFATAFLLFIKALIGIVKMDSGQQIAKVSGIILSMSVSMLMMVGVVKLVSMLTPGEITKGIMAIGLFALMIKAMVNIAKNAGNNTKLAGTLLGMATAIGIMAGVCVLLSMIDTTSLAKGILAVGLLSTMISLMIYSTKGSSNAVKNIVALSAAIAAMVGAVIILAMLDPQKMTTAVACLSSLMVAFGIMSKLSSNAKTSIKSMASVLVVVSLLAAVCAALGMLPIDMTLETAAGLSILILAISGAVAILGTVKKVNKSAIAGVAGVALVVGALASVLGVLNKYDFNVGIETATAMSELILALSTSCAILGSISGLNGSTATNAGKLLLVVTGVAALLTGLAGLVDLIPGAKKFLDGGIEVLQKIGYGLGSFLGNIVGGFSAGATADLPEVGQNLSAFMQAFGQIDGKSLSGIKSFSDAMLEISAANILDGISKFINFGKSPIETFVDNIKTLANGLADVATSLNDNGPIDLSNLNSIANVGNAFAKLQSTVEPVGGLLQVITGRGDLGDFGNQISSYCKNIAKAASSISDIEPENVDNLEVIASVGKAFSALQSTVQPILGLKQAFTGTKDLGDFGLQVALYCNSLKMGISAVKGIQPEGIENLESLASVGQIFSQLQSTVEPAGLLQTLLGEKDLSTFGTQVSWFINQIQMAISSIPEDFDVNIDTVQKIVTVGNMLAELQKALPEDTFFDSKMNLSQFGTKIVSFGIAMSDFSASVADIDAGNISKVVTIGKRLSTLMDSLKNIDISGLSKFKSIKDIGSALNDFASSITFDTGAISSAVSSANKLKSFINGLKDLDTSGISKFQSAISKLGQTDISSAASSLSKGAGQMAKVGSSMTKSLTSGLKSGSGAAGSAASSLVKNMSSKLSGSAGQFSSAGTKLIAAFIKAINAKKGMASAAARAVASGAASAMGGSSGRGYSYGSMLGQGYVNGVRAKVVSAYAAGYAVGAAGARGIAAGQNSNSPSRLAYKWGVYLGEGYVNGAQTMVKSAGRVGYKMGETATQSLADSSQKLAKMVDMSFDSSPTIRPVVDMTDIKKQSSSISALFSDPLMSSTGNIRAIRTVVDNRQNGNDDIVSSINKLRKDLGNVGNTYNSINGITYDNGSEISEAVGTLVRAARIERRR